MANTKDKSFLLLLLIVSIKGDTNKKTSELKLKTVANQAVGARFEFKSLRKLKENLLREARVY